MTSGNIRIHFNSAANAGVMIISEKAWIHHYGEGASLYMNLYGVIARCMPAMALVGDTVRMGKDVFAANCSRMLHLNENFFHHAKWLVKSKSGRKTASCVLKFTFPLAANEAIDKRII